MERRSLVEHPEALQDGWWDGFLQTKGIRGQYEGISLCIFEESRVELNRSL